MRSKINSRAAPHVLHLDTRELQDELFHNPTGPISPTSAPFHSSSSTTNRDLRNPWSLSASPGNEIQKLWTQDKPVTDGETFQRSTTSEDFPVPDQADGTKLEAIDLLPPLQTAAVTQSTRTQPPALAKRAGRILNLHRKYRSLLRKRQTSGSSGKSRHHIRFSQMLGKICLQHGLVTVKWSQMNICLWSCSLSWSDGDLPASQPG